MIMNAQVKEMRNAINKVVAIGPDFLSHKISADDMANTMVAAVKDYRDKDNITQPKTEEGEALREVLQELMNCGSGFLENRCDAACVARTIDYMVKEFPQEAN